jgi:membrane-bound ClpP family serine protease
MRPLDRHIKDRLVDHLERLEAKLSADVVAIISPIEPGLENFLRSVLDLTPKKRDRVAVILETPGGVVEVVERMATVLRHHYPDHVTFIVPNKAMSAGTVLAMSGDRILMDYFSVLGPIDPQLQRDGRFIPAQSYLHQFRKLNEKALSGTLTNAEMILLSKLDLAELHLYEQAEELSKELLVRWLSTYKFKDWTTKESSKRRVTQEDRLARAREIAEALGNNERWHSHSRGITRETLWSELKLKIDDLAADSELETATKEYFELLQDYMAREKQVYFINTKHFF